MAMGESAISLTHDRYVGETVRVAGDESIFTIGDHVRMSTQSYDDPCIGLVTGVMVTPGGFFYCVEWADNREERRHWAVELTQVD
jgi:hypothetical protein